jgi:hypothetical protein
MFPFESSGIAVDVLYKDATGKSTGGARISGSGRLCYQIVIEQGFFTRGGMRR